MAGEPVVSIQGKTMVMKRLIDSSWPYVVIMILGIVLVSGAVGPF